MKALSAQDLDWTDATELARLIRSRAVSPVEVVRRSLQRLETLEPRLKAFVTPTPELALSAAREAEAAVMRGDPLPPLAGIPVSVKDNIAVKGVPLTFGSRTRQSKAAMHAPAVERLVAAGACIVGKTTMTEFGCKASSDSPLTGITRNPWDLSKSAGGSSSGSAASVAAGVTPISVGTDGAGSLRIPAAFCGLVGFKPQFGRVPVNPVPTAPSLLHIGPMARSVRDAALLLSVLSGYDARDPASIVAAPKDFVASCDAQVSGWRIAWSPTLGYGTPDDEVVEKVRAAVADFEALGCKVEQVDRIAEDPYGIGAAEFFAAAAFRLRETLRQNRAIMDREVAEALEQWSRVSTADYFDAHFARYALRDHVRELFQTYRLLLTPTLPVAAFDAELSSPPGWSDRPILSWPTYTLIHNLTGLPAASVPCGRTHGGLPIGLQITGRPNAEADVFAAAAGFESARPWVSRLLSDA